MTETWLSTQGDEAKTFELAPSGFDVESFSRQSRPRDDGMATKYKYILGSNITFKTNFDLTHSSLEVVQASITLQHNTSQFFCLFRPPLLLLLLWSPSNTDDDDFLFNVETQHDTTRRGRIHLQKKFKVRTGCTVPSPLTSPFTKKSDGTKEFATTDSMNGCNVQPVSSARQRGFEIRAYPLLGVLPKAIEPHLHVCQLYRWQIGPNTWSSPTTKLFDPIVVTDLRVGFPGESHGPGSCGFAYNYPEPEAWTTEA